jgi:glyoxylase-like metal-dependent hydrolase (beta-lactamase superfamily II)
MQPDLPRGWKRRFGKIDATILSGGTMRFNVRKYMPEDEAAQADTAVDETGSVPFGTNFLFVRTPESAVMIDPGGWTDDHVRRLDGLRPLALDETMPAMGVAPREVTHVLITHGHHDHCLGLLDAGGRPRFPNARHHIHTLDAAGPGELRELLDPIEEAGLLQPVDAAETEVAPGVTMIHTPGETSGHCTTRIQRGPDSIHYLGDLFHIHQEMAHLRWAMRGRDPDAIEDSRRRVLTEAEAMRSVLLFTHDGGVPPWGTVTRSGPDSWSWRYLA